MKHCAHFSIPSLLLGLSLCAANGQGHAAEAGLKIRDIPPPLKLTKTLQGPAAGEVTWEKLKSKVVVLEFWATWCGPCVRAIPHINELAEQFKDKPVQFIAVTSENEGAVKAFLQRQPFKACVGLDDFEEMNKAFAVVGIPHTVLVDKAGRIAAITHPASLKVEHLEEVLAGKKCSLPEVGALYKVSEPEPEKVANQPPALFEVSIHSEKRKDNGRGANCMWSRLPDGLGFDGEIATVESALHYVFQKPNSRMIVEGKLPEGFYNFHLRAPTGRITDLENQFIGALRITFNLEVKRVSRELDAYTLTVIRTNAPGLQPTEQRGGGGGTRGGFRIKAASMDTVVEYLEEALARPVLDETKFKGHFNVDMKWEMSEAELITAKIDKRVWKILETNPKADLLTSLPQDLLQGESLKNIKLLIAELAKPETQQFQPNPAAVIKAVRERLGLELTPVKRAIEVLEVRAAKPTQDK